MMEYTFYYPLNGKRYTVCANTVDLALTALRQQKSAQFVRECILIDSKPTTSALIVKAV